jgi:hypothetical protein
VSRSLAPDKVYTHVYRLVPRFTCYVVHATAAISGKGSESTVTMLEILAEKLRETPFSRLEYAFVGDSCFNSLYDGFQDAWEGQLSSGQLSSFFGRHMVIPLVIFDPLHLLKISFTIGRFSNRCEWG